MTLPDLDTLLSMNELSANTLYTVEVAHLPSISFADEQELVAQARVGEEEARTMLILSTLRYVLGKARAAYNLNPLVHDDMLDLVQVGTLAMLENLDRALQRDNPVSYLRGIARRAIALYYSYRSSLVSKPASLTQKQREKRGLVTVESLEAPLSVGSTLMRLDLVEAPASDPAALLEEEESAEGQHERYAALHKALETLSPRERQVLTLRFGLDGQPGMRSDTIGELIGGSYASIQSTEKRALAHLRIALGMHETALACFDAGEA